MSPTKPGNRGLAEPLCGWFPYSYRMGPKPPSETGGTDGEPRVVTDEAELDAELAGNDAVLLEFHADWCAACGLLAPALEQLAADRPFRLVRVDVEREALSGIVERYGVSELPSIVLVADGERVADRTGIHDKRALRSFLDAHLD